MSKTDILQIALETEIADAIKQFEAEASTRVIDIRIDRYEGPEFCIGTTIGEVEP